MGRKPKLVVPELCCKEVLTVSEAANILQLREETILRYIDKGELIASRIGRPWRIRRYDLNNFLISKANVQR